MPAQQHSEWQSRREPVREDMALQLRFWKFQAAGWGVAVLVILAALLGLLSDGPFSHAREGAGALSAEYQRFYRSGASASFLLRIPDGQNELVLSNAIVDGLVLETIRPAPLRAAAGAGGTHFVFASKGNGPVFFGIRPSIIGRVAGQATAGGQTVAIETLVYP